MNNLSKAELQQIIETDHVQCGDAAAMARELLARREAAEKPIGSFHIVDQDVEATTDYVKHGEWPIDNGELLVYAEPPITSPLRELLVTYDRLAKEPVALRWRHAADEHSGPSGWNYVTPDRIDDFMRRIAAKDSSVETELVFTAPPLPVVPSELLSAMEEVIRISDRDHDAWSRAKSLIAACRAEMLKGVSFRETDNSSTKHFREIPDSSTNSPVIPDCWALVPIEPTEEMNKAGWRAMNESDAINPTWAAMLAAAPKPQ